MSLKFLGAITILSFIFQIGFSIYYSSKIVDENFLVNDLQQTYQNLSLKNQQLEDYLSSQSSLQNVGGQSQVKGMVPITDSITINP